MKNLLNELSENELLSIDGGTAGLGATIIVEKTFMKFLFPFDAWMKVNSPKYLDPNNRDMREA